MNKPVDDPVMVDAPTAAWAEAGRSRPHESAALHVAGEATYVDDIAELQGTLHCALGLSPVAHGRLLAETIRFSA